MIVPDIAATVTELGDDPDYARLGSELGDRRDGRIYVHDDRIRTAVRVAIATRRPLLLRGAAGSGKSSLAPFVARLLHWRFYSFTVTARTQARDLMWEFDALRRLSDAQGRKQGDKGPSRVDRAEHYIEPKALWWALSPATAKHRGASAALDEKDRAIDPGAGPATGTPDLPFGEGVVVLIDEIDKADPDVPNNLLEGLGSLQFTVQETGFPVRNTRDRAPLVMITTNDERELPVAFQRRCAMLYLKRHEGKELVDIAKRHFGGTREALATRVVTEFERIRHEAEQKGRRAPSTAEYLDAVKACIELEADPQTVGEWTHIEQLTLNKQNPFTKST